jgi:hypothetical protein
MRKKQTIKQPHNTLVGDELVIYQIRVKGLLDERWSDYFSGFTITHQDDGESLLTGPVRDQAALFGILIIIRDVGIRLLSIEQLDE